MTVLTRERVRHEMAVRRLTVVRTRDLAPDLRRITLGGDLSTFASHGPGDHVKCFFPDPSTGELHAPRLTETGIERPVGVELISRDYTPRAWRRGELDIDFVLHGDEGPASAWAARAVVDDPLVVAGPRGSHLPPVGAAWYLLGGDETALPALGRWLDILEPDAVVAVLAEVAGPAQERYLDEAVRRGHTITWLHRGDAAPGSTTLLADAVHDLDVPEGPGFAYFGGEATSLRPVRRHLRGHLGMEPAQVDVSGYWKKGEAGHDHHAPVDPDDPS
jgi:NADPH-dependent ferric siderophore reductase